MTERNVAEELEDLLGYRPIADIVAEAEIQGRVES